MTFTDSRITRAETWARIEREARAQAMAECEAADRQPLEYGQLVAWTEHCPYGVQTDGLSQVHRVATPDAVEPKTFCDELVPPAVRRLALTPRWIGTLGRCKWCESAHSAAAAPGDAA